MDEFLQRPTSERRLYIEEASSRTGYLPIIIEKDLWVCWLLGKLFSLPDLGPHLIFKGGTSLSKAYSVIGRFSEDIDVSLHRSFLGLDPEAAPSKKQREQKIQALGEACGKTIKSKLVPSLSEVITNEIRGNWKLEIDQDDPQTVFFHFPLTGASTQSTYIRPFVRIEFGARSDNWPQEKKRIIPYLAEQFPDLLSDMYSCDINVLSIRRTFWEKTTILHAELHRPEETKLPSRQSRHYYDLYCIAKSNYRDAILQDRSLLERVVEHKQVFFRSKWASYDTATKGDLRLCPKESRLDTLRADFEDMRQMFFETPPEFSNVLYELKLLEQLINDKK